MDQFGVSKTDDSGFHVEGFPDALKLIRIDGPKAQRLGDLALHRADLHFAAECLDGIDLVPAEPHVLRQALWRSAITHYMKCFGDSAARFQLSPERVYKGEQAGLIAFSYFKDLRNKHLVHDENSYAQSLPAAVLNNRDKTHKIEKILCFSAIAETLSPENYSNLNLLIEKASRWVESEFDTLGNVLTEELEKEPYNSLLAREGVSYRVPNTDELGKNRKIP